MATGTIAHAASQTACPAKFHTDWPAGTGVAIAWSFTGIGALVAFYPDQIVYGGAVVPLTQAQVQKYAAILDNLRAAAAARKKVTIFWDSVSRIVSTIVVNWDQPC